MPGRRDKLRSLRKLTRPGMTVVTVTQRKLRGSLRHSELRDGGGRSVPLLVADMHLIYHL